MPPDRPIVSVCIPVHEPDARLVADLLASIAGQGQPGLEVVIVDDASGADLSEVVAHAGVDVRWHSNDRNLGMVDNWNEVVRLSTGRYVIVVGQDDVLGPDMLATFVAAIEAVPGAVACSANELFIDGDGRALHRREPVNRRDRIYRDRDRYVLSHDELVVLSLRNGQAYGEPSSVLVERGAFDRVGGYRAEFEHAADVDFVLRVSEVGSCVYLRDRHLRRRIHADNLTRQHVRSGATWRDRARLFDRWFDPSTLSPRDVRRIRAALASFAAHDVFVALRSGSVRGAASVLRDVRRYGMPTPAAAVGRVVELVTKRNADRR